MDWVRDFYSRTGAWWAKADARITERDHRRVALLHQHSGAQPKRILELGSGYGTTAVAMAHDGHSVTAIEISDRADLGSRFLQQEAPGSLAILKEDFYAVHLPERFDVVCYWNGFGVGSDGDQRRLLSRIAAEWLQPGGVALIDVFNPFVWARWNGDEEHKLPQPTLGYDYELHQKTTFDPVTCIATDTWWEADRPEERISQVLRCYTPADLSLLLEGTGLALKQIVVGDQTWSPLPQPELHSQLYDHHEYLAVLCHE